MSLCVAVIGTCRGPNVTVWCSELQCVAVCCSTLQCVAVCCSVLLSLKHISHVLQPCVAAACCSAKPSVVETGNSLSPVLQFIAVCCSVLQCVAVCCSVLQCVAVCCSVLQCVAVWQYVAFFHEVWESSSLSLSLSHSTTLCCFLALCLFLSL